MSDGSPPCIPNICMTAAADVPPKPIRQWGSDSQCAGPTVERPIPRWGVRGAIHHRFIPRLYVPTPSTVAAGIRHLVMVLNKSKNTNSAIDTPQYCATICGMSNTVQNTIGSVELDSVPLSIECPPAQRIQTRSAPSLAPQRIGRRHQDEWRAKIRVTAVVQRLNKCALGEIEMSPTELGAAKLLLSKVLPDLSAQQVTLDDHRDELSALSMSELLTRLDGVLRGPIDVVAVQKTDGDK